MKKKIIFVTKALWIGGIETALINLLKQLDYDRYEITLLVLHAELDLLDQIDPRCRILILDREQLFSADRSYRYNRLYHLTEQPSAPSCLHKRMMWAMPALRWLENRLYIRYVRDFMKTEAFDTCVIYSDVVGEIAVRAIRANRYLMFYHHGAMRHVYHDAAAWRKCEKVIAVSSRLCEELKAFCPEHSGKVLAVNNLVDIDRVRSMASEACPVRFPTDGFHIVTCGRASYAKGIDIAAEACSQLATDGFSEIHWWIVGSGPMENEVKAQVERLRIADHFHLLGMQKNPYPYIAQADLYVQPSRYESFGITILEAMLLGRPVVSTNTLGAQELIRDGVDGTLCDPEDLSSAIERFIQNREKFGIDRSSVCEESVEARNRAALAALYALL